MSRVKKLKTAIRQWECLRGEAERGNFARDVLFANISFLPPDRYTGGGEVRRVAERIRQAMDVTTATKDEAKTGDVAEASKYVDRDDDFNTRYDSFRGSQMATSKGSSPFPRDTRTATRRPGQSDSRLLREQGAVVFFILWEA